MCGSKIDRKCFTFTWALENVSYCLQKKMERIESPSFWVDEIHNTKWKLRLYPRGETNGNYIGCYLIREFTWLGEEKMEVKYELAFIDENGLSLRSQISDQSAFLKDQGWGSSEFEKREKVFISERSKFLPKDTLRIRCRIWKVTGSLKNDVRCFALTGIGIQKRSFVLKFENFSVLDPAEEKSYLIKSLHTGEKLMSVDLSVDGGLHFQKLIRVKLACCDRNIKYCTIKLCLVDVHGEKVECNQEEFFIDKSDETYRFPVLFPRQKLVEKKSLFLPDDVLSLHWECVFSTGVISQEIEDVQYGLIAQEQKLPLKKKKNKMNKFLFTLCLIILLYCQGYLCDIW